MPITEGTQDEVVYVASPYAGTRLTPAQQLALSSYWLASNVLWGAMLVIVLPSQVKDITAYNLGHLTGPAGHAGLLAKALYYVATQKGPALGLIGSAVAIVSLLVPLVVGPMSDRCMSKWGRRRPYIAVGTALSLAALIYMFLAGRALDLWQFMIAYCIVAFGNNIATAAYFGVIPDLVPEDQRGIASGYMAMMSQIGTLIGAFAAGFLKGDGSFMAAYIVVVVSIAIFAMITLRWVWELPLKAAPPRLHFGQHLRSVVVEPWKHRDFLWVWITRFLVMLGLYSVQPYIQYYLHDVIGIKEPEQTTSIMLGLILVGATISGMYGGFVSERIGRKKVVYFSNVVIAAMCLLLILCRTLPQALLVGVLFGLGYGAYVSVDWALGTDVLPAKKDAGKDMAVWHISMTLPQSITPFIAGYCLLPAFGSTAYRTSGGDITQSYPVGGYMLVFAMAAVFFILGAVFLRNVRKAT